MDTAWPAVVMERGALVDIPVFTGESSLGSLPFLPWKLGQVLEALCALLYSPFTRGH